METFSDKLKARFKQKDILMQLIIINIAVFILLAAFNVITKLFKLDDLLLINYIGISSDVSQLVKFWTPFTYMFVHQDIMHILLNMLMFFWFGRMFLSYFNPKTLGSLYVLGGLAGAALYILAFNTIPYFLDMPPTPMIGASAAVMAIIFGVAFYRPEASMRLFFIGEIKIVYIAIFFFIMDFFALGSASNEGGHIAHIGGAILGYIFAVQYRKGKDITRWVSRIIDSFANFSLKKNKKPKMKVKYKKREAEYEYNARKNTQQEAIDDILDKIKSSGYASLSKDEKKQLFDASNKIK